MENEKSEEEKLLKKYIEGYNNTDVDLFKKIMNEKRNMDAIKKNQKFYEKKSIKIYLNKKRERSLINEEEKEKGQNNNNKNAKKIKRLKKIKKNKINENKDIIVDKEIEKEKEGYETIKNMDNEDDLLDAILA